MRILFCDDDSNILLQLQEYVYEYFQTNNLKIPDVVSYSDGDTLLKMETTRSDIVFLDIEMPGHNGIYVGAKLMKINPKIKIFIVTSYMNYLDDAMNCRVFRYLSKPINKNRLFNNLKDALYQYNLETVEVAIETKDGVIVYSSDDILCIEGTQKKTIVYTVYGTIDSVRSLNYWQRLLKIPCFYQSYRSFIVNMKYITSFNKNIINLRYKDIKLTPYLTRRKYTEFKDRFLLYKESVQ